MSTRSHGSQLATARIRRRRSLAISTTFAVLLSTAAAFGPFVSARAAAPGLLRVTQTQSPVPTQILVDGQIADTWGLNWLKVFSGTHTVCFTHVEGWTEPPCQAVTVNSGATTTVNATFIQRGSLHVSTSPAVASQITLDGNPTEDWGMFTDVPTGAHTVCFGKAANWDPPACQNVTVNAGVVTNVTGTFTNHPGAPAQSGVGWLRISSSPALATQITIKPSAASPYIADSWGLSWLELAPGSYTVSFSHVQGWTEPAPQVVTMTASSTTTVTATFTQRGTLHVFTSPSVAGTISVDGIARDDWGLWTDIATGSHTVCFGAATGYSAPGCQTATVTAGAETQVTGTYGLAAPAAPTNVTVTAGPYSAVVRWAQASNSATSYVVTPYLAGVAQPSVTVGGGTSATVGNLQAAKSYTFTVKASNSAGSATSSPPVAAVPTSSTTSGLGGDLYISSSGRAGRIMYNGGWARHTPLSTSLSNWTIEGYIWNLSYGGTSGGSMAWGLLSGSSSYPSATALAGLQWNGAAGAGSFVWPNAGSYAFSGTQSGSTPTHVVLQYDGANVSGFINGVQAFPPQATTTAAIPSGAWPGFMDNTQLHGASFDEFKVSNTRQYVPTSSFVPGRAVVDGATVVLYHFDDYAGVGKVASQYVYVNGNSGPYDIAGIFGDSTGTSGGDADLFAQYAGCGGLCDQASTYTAYSSTQYISPSVLTGGGLPWMCSCQRHTVRPVNTATGEFWHTFADLTIPGRRVQLDLQRTYSSALSGQSGRFGFGWNDGYNLNITFDGAPNPNPTLHAGNGSSVPFVASGPVGTPTYTGPTFLLGGLTKDVPTGNLVFSDKVKTQYTFTAAGQLTKETDRNGNITSLTYSGGKLSTVTASGGITLTAVYDTTNPSLIHTMSDSAGRVFTYGYDYATNNLISVTDAGHNTGANLVSGVTKFAYDGSHRLTTMQDPNCTANLTTCAYTPSLDPGLGVVHGTTNVYDASNRVTHQYDDRGVLTEFSYAGDGDPVVPTNTTTITEHPTPSTSTVTVDVYKQGLLSSETKAYGTAQAATWLYAYDATSLGLILTVDPSGRATTTTRDAQANPLTATDGAGGVRTLTYTTDGFNQVATDQDPVQAGTSIKTTYTYDTRGNLKQMSRPLDNPVGTLNVYYNRTNVSHPEDVISKQDGDGKVWNYTYDDAKGYLLTAADPLSPADVTHYGYDGAGRLACKVAARGNTACPGTPTIGTFETQYTYDPAGGQTDVLAPLGHHSTALFDANGNRTSATDANGNNTTYVYDAADRLTRVVHPDTSYDQTSYDDLNNLTSQTTVQGTNTYFRFDYTYDLLNHMTAATDNASPRRLTAYNYDAQGELVSLTDPQSQITGYLYDGRGSLSQVSYSDRLTPPVAYTYDADGQRLSMTDGTGSSSYSWDSLHRLKVATNGNAATVAYGYDFRNDVTSIAYPASAGTVQRQFDDAARLQHVQDWLTPSNAGTTFAYDPDGNLKTATYPNGVVATSTYDNADQLQQIADTGAGALFNFNYGQVPRDGLGQLKSDGTITYGYDTRNRVSALNGVANSWTYDAANDLTKSPAASSLTYDGANQLQTFVTAAGTTNVGFDPNGNRILQSPPAGPAVSFNYDQANRLVSYNQTSSYTYNGDGLRASKTTPTTTTQFASDISGSLPLTIQAAANTGGTTTTTNYLTGPGGLPLEQISSTGSVSFFHQDQLGSTRLMTAPAAAPATVAGSYTYDAFGVITVTSGSAPAFGYAGQYTDAESSLVYMQARYYDPSTGQFISRDPAYAMTRQPYAYVSGNPLNATDPTGLCGFWDVGCQAREAAARAAAGVAVAVGVAHTAAVSVARAALAYGAETAGDCASHAAGRVAKCSFNVVMAVGMLSGLGEEEAVGFGELREAGTIAEDAVLPAAEKFLGSGCREISNGVFRSADDARQFRLTDLAGKEAPHVHFESIGRNGRDVIESAKVFIR